MAGASQSLYDIELRSFHEKRDTTNGEKFASSLSAYCVLLKQAWFDNLNIYLRKENDCSGVKLRGHYIKIERASEDGATTTTSRVTIQ